MSVVVSVRFQKSLFATVHWIMCTFQQCIPSLAIQADDPVGALAFRHYYDKDTVAAVIIGNDTNACYIERSDAIVKCRGLSGISGAMVTSFVYIDRGTCFVWLV